MHHINNGGPMHAAASRTPLGTVISAPETICHAPTVNMNIHQIATERARENVSDMPRGYS